METQTVSTDTVYKAFNDLYQVQLKMCKHLADIQVKYMTLWQDYLNSSFQRVPGAKTVADLVAIESGLNAEYGNKFAECSKDAINTLSDAQQELMTCLEKENMMTPMLAAAQDIWEQGERAVREAKPQSRPRPKAAHN